MQTDELVATPAITALRMLGGSGAAVVCAAAEDGVCTVAQPDPEPAG